MTKEEVTKWLDKQIEIDTARREYEHFADGIAIAGVPYTKYLHIWVRHDRLFYEIAEALQKTIRFIPDIHDTNVEASFDYGDYTILTLLDKTEVTK